MAGNSLEDNVSELAPTTGLSQVEPRQKNAESLDVSELEIAIGEITTRVTILNDAREALDSSVVRARAVGASWAAIGRAAGITQQSANARWDPEAKRNKAARQRERLAQRGQDSN